MKIIQDLAKALRRIRVYLFGADISLEKTIRVAGTVDSKEQAIKATYKEMIREAASLLGIELWQFNIGREEKIFETNVLPEIWLGTKRRIYVNSQTRTFGTFYCRRYYRAQNIDDGRRNLRLKIRARGLLPWGPLVKRLSTFN